MKKSGYLVPLALCALVIAGAFLIFKDGVARLLPYAFFLLCPLMHLFMMHGHNHGGQGQDSNCHGGQHATAEKPAPARKTRKFIAQGNG